MLGGHCAYLAGSGALIGRQIVNKNGLLDHSTYEKAQLMVTEPDTRPQTQALIQRAIDSGESYRTLAGRAHRGGHTDITHSYINNLHRGLVTQPPNTSRIEALAVALQQPVVIVRRAVVMDWFGYDRFDGEDFTALALPTDVTPEERAEVEALVQAFLMTRRRRTDRSDE